MLSIGELARASGLTVSALRFYDGAGVLAPVAVDPHTGYRWYAHDQLAPARLVAGLRRVGMPLPEIATAVRHWGDNGTVADLLAAHLRRLEEGLADAKQEISRLRSLLTDEEPHMSTIRLTIARDEFAAALAAVRFAVGADPDLPMINGVLVDVEPDAIRLVATDRYRLAVAEVPARVTGPGGRHLLPTGFVDRIAPLLAEAGEETVTLLLADGRVTLGARRAPRSPPTARTPSSPTTAGCCARPCRPPRGTASPWTPPDSGRRSATTVRACRRWWRSRSTTGVR